LTRASKTTKTRESVQNNQPSSLIFFLPAFAHTIISGDGLRLSTIIAQTTNSQISSI
jgi:hypothetical protein